MAALQGLNPTWDLDAFFPGGSASPEFAAFLDQLEADIAGFRTAVSGSKVPTTLEEANDWSRLLVSMQDLAARLRHSGAFISCLNAQNVRDQQAKILGGRHGQISAAFASACALLDAQVLAMDEAVFAALVAQPEWEPIASVLSERRHRARLRMNPEREALAGDLAVDGYHGWGELYNTVVGRMRIPWEEDGTTVYLSAGQMANKLSDADPAVRAEAMRRWEEAWSKEAELIASSLNHLAGYRINLYKHRGWKSILDEPLENNRMTRQTLDVMWDVVERNKPIFVEFMKRKAQLLGVEKLGWQDVSAPVGGIARKVTYDEAANFIVEHFSRFSPRMAAFAAQAFQNRWIEAEDRPGKRPGGFCTSFPIARSSRIFMTFAGTPGNIATLAHELGHAWHQHVMNEMPQMAQGYAMNVAETASTFAEMIVADAAVKNAQNGAERLALIAEKAERGIAMFMNIHARFIFECDFYEERKQGMLSVERLNALMTEAQQKAYHNALGSWHPTFWASKLHFYATSQPFYNFPYTFGFLFSSGVYARALAEGPAFEQRYVELLRDTGRMRVEELAKRHLGVDLTQPEFWQSAVEITVADAKEFLRLTAK